MVVNIRTTTSSAAVAPICHRTTAAARVAAAAAVAVAVDVDQLYRRCLRRVWSVARYRRGLVAVQRFAFALDYLYVDADAVQLEGNLLSMGGRQA